MKSKSSEEQLKDLEQKIHRLQMEKKKLKKKTADEAKKKRNHAMILVGTTLMTHFDEDTKEIITNAGDDEIKEWVHSLFRKKEPEPAYENESAAETRQEWQ